MTSHIYILAHKSEPRFKIGKANNIFHRARSIGLDEFDLKASIAIEAATEKAALDIEKSLHRLFVKWRLKSELVSADQGGATEWFDEACRSRLEGFIESNLDLLGLRILRDLQIVPPDLKNKKDERQEKLIEKEKRRAARAEQKLHAEEHRIKKLVVNAPLVAAKCNERLRQLLDSSTFAFVSVNDEGMGTRLYFHVRESRDGSKHIKALERAERDSIQGRLGSRSLFPSSGWKGVGDWTIFFLDIPFLSARLHTGGDREDSILEHNFQPFRMLLDSLSTMDDAIDQGLIPEKAMKLFNAGRPRSQGDG
ncbi:GIY-YIG nuclease family protein [Hydrogenophaga sp. 2FB]|uniref:GIY-YIG nuclease family protein n=1 Tax=Hydrogenophaga sp. 2FB TaxID=2502187 RepID=UPI0010F6ADA6|nr:GIY-YIG nuclease family protein [Hydrogenophaga sp. 2FB]